MIYQKLNSKKANIFKNEHQDYNIYIYNSKLSILFKISDGKHYNCSNFLYLVNSDEDVIKMSQLCKKQNNYSIVFVDPDEIDIQNQQII